MHALQPCMRTPTTQHQATGGETRRATNSSYREGALGAPAAVPARLVRAAAQARPAAVRISAVVVEPVLPAPTQTCQTFPPEKTQSQTQLASTSAREGSSSPVPTSGHSSMGRAPFTSVSRHVRTALKTARQGLGREGRRNDRCLRAPHWPCSSGGDASSGNVEAQQSAMLRATSFRMRRGASQRAAAHHAGGPDDSSSPSPPWPWSCPPHMP